MTIDLSRRNFLKLVTVMAAASVIPDQLAAEVESKQRSIRFREAIRLWKDDRIVHQFDMLDRDLDFEMEIQNDFMEIDAFPERTRSRPVLSRRQINLRIGERHFVVQKLAYAREFDDPDEWLYIDIKEFAEYDPEKDRLLWRVGSEFPQVVRFHE